jgi:hypothetical protein
LSKAAAGVGNIFFSFLKFGLDPISENPYSPPQTKEHTTARKRYGVPKFEIEKID